MHPSESADALLSERTAWMHHRATRCATRPLKPARRTGAHPLLFVRGQGSGLHLRRRAACEPPHQPHRRAARRLGALISCGPQAADLLHAPVDLHDAHRAPHPLGRERQPGALSSGENEERTTSSPGAASRHQSTPALTPLVLPLAAQVYVHPPSSFDDGDEENHIPAAAAAAPSSPSNEPLLEISRPRPRQWSPSAHSAHFEAAYGDAVRTMLCCHSRLQKARKRKPAGSKWVVLGVHARCARLPPPPGAHTLTSASRSSRRRPRRPRTSAPCPSP